MNRRHAIDARRFGKAKAGLILGLALLIGCGGPPQVGPNNYRLLAGLRTALSARRVDWLDASAKVISERHASGDLNDEQAAAFEAIVAQARGGDWDAAEAEAIRLAKAQRTSTEPIHTEPIHTEPAAP